MTSVLGGSVLGRETQGAGLGIREQASLLPSCQTPSPAPFKEVHSWKGLPGARGGNLDFPPDGSGRALN